MSTEPKQAHAATDAAQLPQDNIVVSQHTITLGDEPLHYTVTTGTVVLKESVTKKEESKTTFEGHKPKAEIFFVAYTKNDVPEPSKRPITFSFNGGPGSSSIWLHLGALGPKRVMMQDTTITPPPYTMADNPYTLLTDTDLVFIDPVSTGYSRPLPGEHPNAYHTLKQDIASVAEFIRLYTTRHKRWLSPKYLVGESYGTTRAAGLAEHLQDKHGLYLNGLMLVSCVLDFATVRFAPNNELPHILYLPTFAATAWYHKKLPKKYQELPLTELVAKAERFALGEYALALLQGSSLPHKDEKRVMRELAALTGLSEDYLRQTNLRPEIMRFTKELRRDEGLTVGRLDSRFVGRDRDGAGEHFEFDPSMAAIMGPYTAVLYHYIRGELGYENDIPYEVISMDVNKAWQWEATNQYVDVAESLRKAMTMNPHLRVHVANGYFDLATPHFATEYTFNHLPLSAAQRRNISMSYYEAGHMMYVNEDALASLFQHLSVFLKG
jgi:carboxypeptidase C (cathepsin A)